MWCLDYGFVSAFAALIFEAINLADKGDVWTALITFSSVVMYFGFVILIAFWDVVVMGNTLVMWCFILFGWRVVAAVPVIAIDKEHILGIEVVIVKLTHSLFLILQCCLHIRKLLFWIDDVDGPFLIALLLANSSQSALQLSTVFNCLERVVALQFFEGGQRFRALDACTHVLPYPV